MNALFDTNVVLDVLLARAPFVTDSNACFLQVEDGQLRGYLGATTVTALDHLISSSLSGKASRQQIERLLDLSMLRP